jgi:hypothetical protein
MIDQLCRSAVIGDDREKAQGYRFDDYASAELSNAR